MIISIIIIAVLQDIVSYMPRPCNDSIQYSCYGALEIVGAITITITSG